MNKFIVCLLFVLGMGIVFNMVFPDATHADELDAMVANIHWYGAQSSFRIDAGTMKIYIDPFEIPQETHDADIVLITHSHADHYSRSDLKWVAGADTIFIAPKDCVKRLEKKFKTQPILSEPGMKTEVKGIQIEAVPAYNIRKTQFHPKEKQWVGYILTVDGMRIYHAGDTERIPEMKTFTCDIAMLPLGQTYTMNKAEDAADTAVDVGAKIAIPMHYGIYEGSRKNAKKFAKLLERKVKVVIKEKIK